MKMSLLASYIVPALRLMGNGNDTPVHTLHLEFSDEKQKITVW